MDSSSDSSSVTSSIDSTENSETKSAFQAAKDQVDATDGDLVLECARGRDVKSPTETNYAFQVHRIRLAALSGFFQDMLDLASPNGSRYAVQDPTLEIPKVRMEEDWETVYILIGWAYNNRDIIRDLYRGCSWDLLLRVYNASHKYQFHTLEQLISNLMQWVELD